MLLFDPSTYKQGKNFSISYFVPSRDGKKIALGLAEGGAEISTIRVFNVDTKKFYPESIYPSWFGVSGWTGDSKGFIYTQQKSGDKNSMDMLMDASARYHVVGTQPANDKLIFSREHNPDLGIKPEDICFVYYSEDYKYIIGELAGVNQDRNLFYAPAEQLLKENINWKRLIQSEDSVVNFAIHNDKVFLLSHNRASKFKVLMSSLNDLDVKNAKTILPEGDQTIVYITRSKDYLFIIKSDGINSHVDQFNFSSGKIESVKLPINGTSDMYPLDVKTNDCILFTTSWKQPTTIYDYNTTTQKTTLSSFNIPVKYPGIEELVVEEVEVPGHDGVMIPLSIIYNKKIKKDGNNVCYMTGYGAYGISSTPGFGILHLALLNRGVVIAETHPRGGSEKGDNWYKAGYKTTKPNTWKDFISSGEYLVKNGYTSPQHLIGEGTSAGGILIGRAITERPDLFAAAISNVSCSNALRFENTPNGPNNSREFGTVKDSAECMGLMEMDAFQHVKPGVKYPAVICTGGMNDPRVIVWQPAKFAAALQNASSSGKPVLLQVNYDNVHFTEDKMVTYRNFANMYSFALWQAGHKDFQSQKAF